MSTKLDEQIDQLNQTTADFESQRSIPGDGAVGVSLIQIRKNLADLQILFESECLELICVPQWVQ